MDDITSTSPSLEPSHAELSANDAPPEGVQAGNLPSNAASAIDSMSERQYVHHSYIWLGSLRIVVSLIVIIIASNFSLVVGLFSQGGSFLETAGYPIVSIIAVGMGAIVVLLVLIFLLQWWAYKHLYYELMPEEFNFYSGIFNKKHVHVAYQRIQSVDQHATLMQRVFGVCTVVVDTAGGARNKAIKIPYVQNSRAETLRYQLFALKQLEVTGQPSTMSAPSALYPSTTAVASADPVHASTAALSANKMTPEGVAGAAASNNYTGNHNIFDAPAEIWEDVRGVFGGEPTHTGSVTYRCGLSNKELVLTALTNNSAFFVVVLTIISGASQLVGPLVSNSHGAAQSLVEGTVSFGSHLFGGNVIAFGVFCFAVVALLLWVLSAVGTCVSLGGFKALRRNRRIEVEYGLLQHQFHGVDIARVQSVIIKQSIIRRLLGYGELSLGKIDAADESRKNRRGASARTGVIIHPFIKLDRIPEVLKGLAPEFADVPTTTIPVAPVALRRALLRRCIVRGWGFWLAVLFSVLMAISLTNAHLVEKNVQLLALTAALFPVMVVGYGCCAIVFLLEVVASILWFRSSSFAYNKKFMMIANGGLACEKVSFPRQKIQIASIKSNPFQRHAHTVTLRARTAAGVGGTTTRLIDVSECDAQAWLDWVKPHGSVIQ